MSKRHTNSAQDGTPHERLSLDRAVSHLLEECRTIVPGVQALIGFQLVAVFNQRFGDRLSAGEQRLHVGAIACTVVAMALVMAPAALHRETEPQTVSQRFLDVARGLMLWSLAPLALGLSLDVYVVARLVLDSRGAAAGVAAAMFAILCTFWFVLPRSDALERLFAAIGRPTARRR